MIAVHIHLVVLGHVQNVGQENILAHNRRVALHAVPDIITMQKVVVPVKPVNLGRIHLRPQPVVNCVQLVITKLKRAKVVVWHVLLGAIL